MLFVHVATGMFGHCTIEQNINDIMFSVIGLVDLLLHMLHVAFSATVIVEYYLFSMLSIVKLYNCPA